VIARPSARETRSPAAALALTLRTARDGKPLCFVAAHYVDDGRHPHLFAVTQTHRRRRGIDDGPQRRVMSHATFAGVGKNAHYAGHLNSQHPAKCAFASITPQFPMATREYANSRGDFLEQFLATRAVGYALRAYQCATLCAAPGTHGVRTLQDILRAVVSLWFIL